MDVERIIRDVQFLARLRDQEHEAYDRGTLPLRNSKELVRATMESIRRRSNCALAAAERPMELALRDYLCSLDKRFMRMVDLLRRTGKDNEDILCLSRLRLELNPFVIASDLGLAKNLENGLAIARRDGVDLDADFWPDSEPNLTVRYFSVYWDREVPARAGAAGLLQVESLVEGTKDVSNLVDQGLFIDEKDRLVRVRYLLAESLGCSIDEIEVDEPDEG